MKGWFWALVLCGIPGLTANAIEINGTVRSVVDKYATVVADSNLVPTPGDKVEIFFKLSGSKVEISVANGHVYEITGANIMVEIEKATGAVAKDQLARITSPNPKTKETRAAPGPSGSQPAATAALARRFAGKWNAVDKNASYSLTLSEAGNRVTGTYDLQGGSLDGVIEGDVLVATWRQPDNRRGGSAKLKLSADGETLSGRWEYDPSSFNSGLSGSGTWTFNRASETPLTNFTGSATESTSSPQAGSSKRLRPGEKISRPGKSQTAASPQVGAGGQPATITRSAPTSAGGSDITDLVNPAQKILGTWQGTRHRKQYFADGTFVTDPHLVPDAPRLRWRIEGDRLTEYYPEARTTITVRIVSMTNHELVTTDDQGHTFRAQRIPDEQAQREKANW